MKRVVFWLEGSSSRTENVELKLLDDHFEPLVIFDQYCYLISISLCIIELDAFHYFIKIAMTYIYGSLKKVDVKHSFTS